MRRKDERAVKIDDSSVRDETRHEGCFSLSQRMRMQFHRALTCEKCEILPDSFESFQSSDRYRRTRWNFSGDDEERQGSNAKPE